MAKGKSKARKRKKKAKAWKMPLGNPSILPGTFASRVFIGGSYKDTAGVTGIIPRFLIKEICQVVRACGLHPIVADEFAVERPEVNIHHDAMFLLSACRSAVFELTEFSGALMEIERSTDYGTHCLILYHDLEKSGLTLSWMLSSFVHEHADRIRLFGYLGTEDAGNAARNWLDEMLRRSHAGK
jgi:hypothetical protein